MSATTQRKPSAEVRAHEEHVGKHLAERGWRRWKADGRWHHVALGFGWPMVDAARLQAEADDNMQDVVCASLRGELWPV